MDETHASVEHEVTVVVDGTSHAVRVAPGETLLAASRRHGLDLPFSCVAGVCGACVATLEAGDVRMKANFALREKQLARGLVLTCQAEPLGEGCRVRFDGV